MSDIKAILEQFKRGGKGFTYTEWQSLSSNDQAMAIEVETALNKEFAALVAYYLQNPGAMYEILGGEDAAVQAALKGHTR